MRILILGGTTEASRLAAALSSRPGIEATLSYAGRTANPIAQPIPVRTGGFGGAEGLAHYLSDNAIDLLIDATHPFAARISVNAVAAAKATGTDIVALIRPPWVATEGDRWIEVADNTAALAALGSKPRRVFLTIGRQGVGDFRDGPHHYIIRAIEPPDAEDLPASHSLILTRDISTVEDEIALMREARIDMLVTKNSGGDATYAKIVAARALDLPVVMIARPARPDVREFNDIDACLQFIKTHGSPLSPGTERRV